MSDLPQDVETDTPLPGQQRGNNLGSALANIQIRAKDIIPQYNPFVRFKDERKRIETFSTWPSNAAVKKEDLARNGFIYLKINDRVQCVFCRGVLSDWDVGDVVRDEHRRFCPECPFAFGYECGNIPIYPVSSSSHSTVVTVPVQGQNSYQHTFHIVPQSNSTNVAGRNMTHVSGVQEENRADAHGDHDTLPSLPNPQSPDSSNTSPTDKPRYPAWSSEQTRLRSFKGWPPQMSQIPRDLANAGFVYLGNGDRCKCYWCGGELYEWEQEDQPWEEHAKWFPYCNFVRRVKGDNYIKYIKDKQNGLITEYPTDLFSSPHVLAVLQSGYTKDQVQEVLCRFGNSLVDAKTIIEAIKHTQRERQQLIAQFNAANSRGVDIAPVTHTEDDVSMGEPETVSTPQQATSQPELDTNVKRIVAPSSSSTSSKYPTSLTATTESERSRDSDSSHQEDSDKTLCKICMDSPLSVTFVPCGHLSTCEDCAKNLRECPICRRRITDKVKTYWS